VYCRSREQLVGVGVQVEAVRHLAAAVCLLGDSARSPVGISSMYATADRWMLTRWPVSARVLSVKRPASCSSRCCAVDHYQRLAQPVRNGHQAERGAPPQTATRQSRKPRHSLGRAADDRVQLDRVGRHAGLGSNPRRRRRRRPFAVVEAAGIDRCACGRSNSARSRDDSHKLRKPIRAGRLANP
jgi:hypothetical protein